MASNVPSAAPDAESQPRASIHLIFINAYAQLVLLDALSRHATTILEATARHDFVTQIAAFDLDEGLGVVVPHLAQRAALQAEVPALTRRDPATGAIVVSAVDTMERFQGGERTVILIGVTESDREYVLVAGKFLLDPRRLTVALSRAKRKMVLVAARSVFEVFSTDEETFANAQLWKNLLRGTRTVPLWHGERDGVGVEVWGNHPTTTSRPITPSHS